MWCHVGTARVGGAEAAGASEEEDRGVGLGEDEEGDKGYGGVDGGDPESPAPADRGGGVA